MSDLNLSKVDGKEATWLFAILLVSKIFFADISRYVNHSGTAAYIQTAWCALLALALFLIASRLAGDNDIFQASYIAFGNIGMKAVGLLLTLLLLIDAGVMLRVYADIISSIALPEASDFFIIALLITAASFAAFAGVNTLTAFSYIAGIVLFSFLGVILILNIPNYDPANIYPVLGNGADKIFSGIGGLSVYADIFLIFLLASHFNKHTSIYKTGTKAIVIAGVAVSLTTLMYILTVPYPAASHFSLPVLEIAFDVNLDVIFQRAEGLFFFLWIFSGFIMIGAYICFSILSFEKTFNLADRRAVIGVFLLIAACIALRADTSSVQSEAYNIFYTIFTVVAFALPVVVYSVKRIRERL